MGVVYKTEDLKLKRTIALKFQPASFARTGTHWSDPGAPGIKSAFRHSLSAQA